MTVVRADAPIPWGPLPKNFVKKIEPQLTEYAAVTSTPAHAQKQISPDRLLSQARACAFRRMSSPRGANWCCIDPLNAPAKPDKSFFGQIHMDGNRV
jgi:hypothetical protein